VSTPPPPRLRKGGLLTRCTGLRACREQEMEGWGVRAGRARMQRVQAHTLHATPAAPACDDWSCRKCRDGMNAGVPPCNEAHAMHTRSAACKRAPAEGTQPAWHQHPVDGAQRMLSQAQ